MIKRNLFRLMAIMMVTTLCMGFTACGDDDDEDVKNPIVATWTNVSNENQAFQFKSNGQVINHLVNPKLKGVVDNSICPSIKVEMEVSVIYPDNGSHNMPVIIEFGFGGDPTRTRPGAVSWKEMVIGRGWAAATITPSSIQADAGSGLTNGIIGLCNKGAHRQPADWGSLRAWG